MKKDNTTLAFKLLIRKKALSKLVDESIPPVILETHGGKGEIFKRLYHGVDEGIVFDTSGGKTSRLAKQRPTWRVYESDCVMALTHGVGADMPITLLDVDPYGDPWPTIKAFFHSARSLAPAMAVAVNDGLRQKLRIGAWDVGSMSEVVANYGNKIHGDYLLICRELMETITGQAGYTLDWFSGYYCGYNKQMTHYLALLKKG
jgi:hypothetical protein